MNWTRIKKIITHLSMRSAFNTMGIRGNLEYVTPETCGTIGERTQVIIVWVKAPRVKNASHPHRLGVTRVRP